MKTKFGFEEGGGERGANQEYVQTKIWRSKLKGKINNKST